MNRTTSVALCLVLGTSFFLLTPFASSSQAGPFATPAVTPLKAKPVCISQEPHPKDIVNLDGLASYTMFGQDVVVYTVPANRYLIVTDVILYPLDSNWNRPDAALIEDLAGVQTIKASGAIFGMIYDANHNYGAVNPDVVGHLRFIYQPQTGLVFGPGSQVVLKNGSAPNPGTHYHINGFLA